MSRRRSRSHGSWTGRCWIDDLDPEREWVDTAPRDVERAAAPPAPARSGARLAEPGEPALGDAIGWLGAVQREKA